jgi:hypothetical protein
MSAGIFIETTYEANYGAGTATHPIKLQPETLLADIGGTANAPAAGAPNNPISALVSKSRRGLGLHPRFVYLLLTGAPPAGYEANSRARLVCLTTAFYALAAIRGTVVNYLGTTWKVTGFDAEKAI